MGLRQYSTDYDPRTFMLNSTTSETLIIAKFTFLHSNSFIAFTTHSFSDGK